MVDLFDKDNIYKFIFIASSVLLVYLIHDYYNTISDMSFKLIDSNEMIKSIELKMALKDSSIDVLANQLEFEKIRNSLYEEILKTSEFKTLFIGAISLISIIISGYYWYTRIQVYNDRLLKMNYEASHK